MDYERIKSLLEKYWSCETTLEEEEYLREQLSRDDLPQDLREFASLFRYFKIQKDVKTQDGFEDRIIDTLSSKNKSGKRRYLSIFYKVAAAVILLLFVFTIHQRFITVRDKATTLVQDTFEDPEKALEETKKALMLVSEKWNKGKNNIVKLSEFKKAEKTIKNEKL